MFVGDTPVLSDDGKYYPIESFPVGSAVMSRCENTGEMAVRKVLKTFSNVVETYYVFYDRPDKVDTVPLRVTIEHPIWVRRKGWTPVRELQVGDLMQTTDATPMTVAHVRQTGSKHLVYNLHIEDFHTYFVGDEGIWANDINSQP